MKITQDTLKEFRHALRQLESEIGLSLSGETDCCGVTVSQCHLILEMDRCPGASLAELSDRLHTDKSGLSRTVDTLVQDGLANRAENPDNRRKVSLNLTENGKKKVDYINGLCNASYSEVFMRIPEARHEQIIESIQLLADAMFAVRKETKNSCCRLK